MGTQRDEALIQEIAEAVQFDKMKIGKRDSELEMFRMLMARNANQVVEEPRLNVC